MFTKSAASMEWIPAGYEGTERTVLRMSPAEKPVIVTGTWLTGAWGTGEGKR